MPWRWARRCWPRRLHQWFAELGPAMPQSALGSDLAAQHAQMVHDYRDAANFLDRALAADNRQLRSRSSHSSLRVSDGHLCDEAVPLAQRIIDIDGRSGLAGLVLLEQDLKAGKYDTVVQRAAAMPREGAQALRRAVDARLGGSRTRPVRIGACRRSNAMNGVNGIAAAARSPHRADRGSLPASCR